MAQHDQASHHQTVTVVSSMPSPMTPHQQQQPNVSTMQQQSNTSVSSMPSLQNLPQNSQHPQQISAEWGHSRVQVIQQPLQNSTYLQQLYNAQGPLIMPGNIALHPGINSQQIQVIAAGKPFQGNQLAPHMLTTQGKQVLQGQTASAFPGYTTIPTIPTTQNQTFVFSPLGVINSQASLLSAQSQPAVSIAQHQKNTEMHKLIGGGKVSQGKVVSTSGAGAQSVPAQCVQVSQPVLGAQQPPQAQILSPLQAGGQAMQFAPWQLSGALPQMWAGGLPAGALPAGGLLAPNPIFIRGTQPEQSMFIQHSPQSSLHQNTSNPPSSTAPTVKPRASTEGMSKTPRPLSNILPGGLRPAASVSTQTIAGQQPNQVKQRGKQGVRSPAPTSKQDAANQTNKVHHQMQQPKPQLLVMNSAGQMTPLTSSAADKNVLNKAMQQQTLLHQQHQAMQQQQQQQQQQQLLQQQQQQLVQHYQQQGMALGMAQGTLPVGSVAQTNLMAAAGIPQTISMVQQIHPQLVGSALQTSVGLQQPHTLNQNTLTNGLALDGASFLTAPLVQVSPILQQEVSSNSVVSPQLTLQTAQGPVGLIAAPMQGAMLHMPSTTAPSATVPVANVKNEEADKQQATTQSVSAATTTEAELSPANTTADAGTSSAVEVCPSPAPASPAPAPAVITTDAAVSTTTTTSTPATSVADRIKETFSKVSIKKSESSSPPRSPGSSAGTASVSTAPAHSTASAAHTVLRSTALSMPSLSPVPTSLPTMPKYTPHSASLSTPSSVPVPHTTAATTIGMVASTSSTSVTSSITTPISSAPLFKTSHSSARHMSQASHDKGLPKAMVKPNILTHVIEGYVIQEAGEPFAVNRPLREWIADKDQDKENKLPTPDEPPRKKQMLESSSGSHSSRVTASASTSSEGASGSGLSKVKAPAPVGAGPAETSAVPKPTEEPAQSVPNAQKWSVAEVCEFIRKIPGCAGYADEFLVQEVDGEALLLIRPEHLVMALSMKLGPALKIVACIDSLRPDSDQSQHEQD